MELKLEIKNLTCSYGSETIIEDISFDVETGEILCILGPNGVGKTTLFKTILGFLNKKSGSICLDGEDITSWSRREFAKAIAYVPQGHSPPFPYRVIDVVVMGRTAHLGIFSSPSKKDFQIAEDVINSLGIGYLIEKPYTEISGGERQLVLIARALTQDPKILIMDEPTSNLDYGNQIRVLEHIKRLSNSNIGVIMTSHFPDHAFIASSRVLVLSRGFEYRTGRARDILTSEFLGNVYNADIQIDTVLDRKHNRNIQVCVPIIND